MTTTDTPQVPGHFRKHLKTLRIVTNEVKISAMILTAAIESVAICWLCKLLLKSQVCELAVVNRSSVSEVAGRPQILTVHFRLEPKQSDDFASFSLNVKFMRLSPIEPNLGENRTF